MSPASGRQKVRRDLIPKLEKLLDELPERQSDEIGKAEAIRLLLPKIHVLRAKGLSLVEIAEQLTGGGVPITPNLLRTYLVRGDDAARKKRKARKQADAPKKPERAERDAARGEASGTRSGEGAPSTPIAEITTAAAPHAGDGHGLSRAHATTTRTQPSTAQVEVSPPPPVTKEAALSVPASPTQASAISSVPASTRSSFTIRPDTEKL